MEAVAPNALRGELARQCEFLRQGRLAAMKCGVEAGDLRCLGDNRADCTDDGDVMRLMQRGERYQAFEHGHDLAVDQHRLRISRPAMDNPVAHAIKAGLAADMRREPIMDGGYGAGMAVARNRPIGQLFPLRVGDFQMGRGSNALDLAMSACRKGPVGHGLEYRELDAGRPGIDDEDRFAHRGHPASLPDPAYGWPAAPTRSRNAARNSRPGCAKCSPRPLVSALVGAVIGSSAMKPWSFGAKTWA